MTVKELIDKKWYKVINEGDETEREIGKVFCCDLLSIAMGKAPEGCAWVTVMGNIAPGTRYDPALIAQKFWNLYERRDEVECVFE